MTIISTPDRIRLATRGSALALWQANRVADKIKAVRPGVAVDLVVISTRPDRHQDRSLNELGGDKGLFVKEVELAILDGKADAAVHSLKDVPIDEMSAGLSLAAYPEREDARDVLVSRNGIDLQNLAPGSTIATSSPRRAAQVLEMRPDLKVCDVRGNVETRLQKLEQGRFDAIIMAAAGLKRLGLENRITQFFEIEEFIPAAGQGILTVQAPKLSPFAETWRVLDNGVVRTQAEMEREFCRIAGADCHSPVGCYFDPNAKPGRLSLFLKTSGKIIRNQLEITTADELRRELTALNIF